MWIQNPWRVTFVHAPLGFRHAVSTGQSMYTVKSHKHGFLQSLAPQTQVIRRLRLIDVCATTLDHDWIRKIRDITDSDKYMFSNCIWTT